MRNRLISEFTKLVGQFYTIKRQLDEQIHFEDEAEVRRLDRELSHLCEAIIDRPVDCARERHEKLEFLLNLFAPAQDRTPLQERCCESIHQMIVGRETEE